jgi:predicted ABC-type ATPase
MKPKLLIIAGPNGAGKTSVTNTILRHTWVDGCEYVNPDLIARDQFGDWNSHEAVLKAAQHAARLREACLDAQKNLIIETGLSAPDKIDFVKRAKDSGYFVRLFFIGTNGPQINAARVASRVLAGGHDVPISKIISRYGKSISNCATLSAIVDRLYVYDNSVDNASQTLLFRAADGLLVKQYAKINDWAKVILETLQK